MSRARGSDGGSLCYTIIFPPRCALAFAARITPVFPRGGGGPPGGASLIETHSRQLGQICCPGKGNLAARGGLGRVGRLFRFPCGAFPSEKRGWNLPHALSFSIFSK